MIEKLDELLKNKKVVTGVIIASVIVIGFYIVAGITMKTKEPTPDNSQYEEENYDISSKTETENISADGKDFNEKLTAEAKGDLKILRSVAWYDNTSGDFLVFSPNEKRVHLYTSKSAYPQKADDISNEKYGDIMIGEGVISFQNDNGGVIESAYSIGNGTLVWNKHTYASFPIENLVHISFDKYGKGYPSN